MAAVPQVHGMIRDLHPHARPQRTFDARSVSVEARECGYEPSDWPVRKVAIGSPGLFLLVLAVLASAGGAVAWLSPHWIASTTAGALENANIPQPRLQIAPRRDRELVENAQRDRISHAPVPLDVAIERLARRGWRDGDER